MEERSTMVRRTVGIDLGDRVSRYCVVGAGGLIEHEDRLMTRNDAVQRWAESFPPSRMVLEAGTHSPWVSRLLEECGHEVLVANPARLRMIYQNDNKNDEIDARSLARLGRLDPELLAPIRHRSVSAQADLAVIRARDCVVRARSKLINHVRGAVKAYGGRLPSSSAPAFPDKVRAQIPSSLLPALDSILSAIRQLSAEISTYDRQIEATARERYPIVATNSQPNGVGTLTALTDALVIGDPHRFRRSRSVGPYLGLRPRHDRSGGYDPQLRITHSGDELLRRLLVQSAHYMLGPFGQDSELRRMGLALCTRGGKNAKKRAIVAVARKLAVLMHRLWITGEDYDPFWRSKENNVA
jgi:transposase